MGLTATLQKVFLKLHKIEEKPFCILKKYVSSPNTPFDPNQNVQYDDYIIRCIYSEEPEVVIQTNVVSTKKAMYLYIAHNDLQDLGISNITINDRVVFPYNHPVQIPILYKIVQVQYIFGLWKMRLQKAT